MTSTHRHGKHSTHGGFDPGQAGEAMWRAMDHWRTSLDKRVATRMGRGNVRTAILALLSEQPLHGYQIIREIEERTDGRWKPSAGSVYPTLQQLADEGVIEARTADGRKTYSVTDAGREEADAAAEDVPWMDEEPDEPRQFGALSKAGLDLAQAVAQVARTGSAPQQEQAIEALGDARRRIYSILAQD